ncbi:PEP/pyruvate-binding domain-containing protein [Desulfobacula sp.]|uniref:PEP/pyruvate-binding domain-containing protein n=1 Tax=Desulfobacula sp. TaxID=2593537 RepID=UPI00263A3711|nr:PEP/pyruvate-binding domain-containing protein [Desulfobacula sp.]
MLIKNLFRYWTYQVFSPGTILREKYESFKALLEYDKAAHEFMATLEDIYYTQKKCDFQAVVKTYEDFAAAVSKMIEELLKMCPSSYWSLKDYFKKFDFYIRFMLAPQEFEFSPPFTIGFDKISSFNETVTGRKAFSLSCLNNELHLPAPDGFVITTNAFHYFLETNDLREPINEKLAHLDISDSSSLERTARKIEQLILNATVPENIDVAVTSAINSLGQDNKINFRVALRSSAVKEDGKTSFAGQYQTLLNINKEDVLNGYKQVIAGKYSARALFYRVSHGILDDETPMAVLVLEMIDSKTSGVMYTRDIEDPLSDNLLIHSVWGQGELLVEGEASPDVIRVSKKNPVTIVSTKIATKLKQMVLEPKTQTRTVDTGQDKKNLLSLDAPSILTLARWGVSLETHFNQPQDIEWSQDKSGKLFILQSRPLNIHPGAIQNNEKQVRTTENKIINTIICSGGEIVSPGTGSGPVYRLEHLSQINHIPDGSVVVVRHALPQFVTAINKMNAIIIGTGSRASHFSSIAREFGIPAIVNVNNGFHDLIQGNRVTVDADKGIVYEGTAKSLLKRAAPKEDFFMGSSFMAKLRYVINFSAKLKLTNPDSSSFVPEACRSLHDIIRFIHETAVKEMFLIGDRKGGRKKGAKKLISNIPMLFYVLDVGQGIKDEQMNEKILRPEDIACVPMKAVLKGLSNPGICWSETTHFDWEEYDRIVMAGGIISADSSMFGSYAVLSKEYLNVNLRFGYHFVILDTICSSSKEDNYILFRFSGGGGSPVGRFLRANFIKEILTRLGFMVEIKSDLIDAEFKHGSLKTMKETLDMTGRLLGATKLMDMSLKENTELEFLIDDFMNGRYDFRSAVDKGL